MIENNGPYDIIGDVHGHGEILEKLLQKMGYQYRYGYYRHPGRTAVFLGDLIDRGPENFRTLEIVKPMVEQGSALIVMGNHEYNALCYHTRDHQGNFLRPHSRKNFIQHREVLEEIEKRGNHQWKTVLEWFRRMPLFLELEGVRIVHACWDQWSVDFVKHNHIVDHRGRMTNEFLIRSSQKGTGAFRAVERLLKGLEIRLPPGHPGIYDRDHNLRHELRLKWWMNPREWNNLHTYDQVVRADESALTGITGLEIPRTIVKEIEGMKNSQASAEPPVFFGHYWFTGEPQVLTGTAACLDYSVAHGGKLVCYRWDGEAVLDTGKLLWL